VGNKNSLTLLNLIIMSMIVIQSMEQLKHLTQKGELLEHFSATECPYRMIHYAVIYHYSKVEFDKRFWDDPKILVEQLKKLYNILPAVSEKEEFVTVFSAMVKRGLVSRLQVVDYINPSIPSHIQAYMYELVEKNADLKVNATKKVPVLQERD
jgi:hypothetical protein